MNNIAVCVQDDNKNVSPKETIDAIYEAGFKDRYFVVHLHDNDKSGDLHLLPFDGTVNWNFGLQKLKENNYKGPITLELCYRYDYLKMDIDKFYKEGYRRGEILLDIYNK